LTDEDLKRFHPLKAGRRLGKLGFVTPMKGVSIPSRRVGDFPLRKTFLSVFGVSIPSRRVGDSVDNRLRSSVDNVSIPSRRVGD